MRKNTVAAISLFVVAALTGGAFFYLDGSRQSQSAKEAVAAEDSRQDDTGDAASAGEDGQQEALEENRELIGVLLPSAADDKRWMRDAQVLLEELSEAGYMAEVMYAGGDASVQSDQILLLVEQQVKALVIAPVEARSLAGSLAQAYDAGIGIISYDSLLMDTSDINYFLTFNTRAIGQDTGEAIHTRLGLDSDAQEKPFTVEYVMGEAQDDAGLFFFNGIMERLASEYEKETITTPSGRTLYQRTCCGGDVDGYLTNILDGFYTLGDYPDCIVTGSYELALDVVDLLHERGLSVRNSQWPLITTVGADVMTIRAIADDMVSFTLFPDNRKLAKAGAKLVDTYMRGESPSSSNYGQYDNGVRIVRTVALNGELIDKKNYWKLIDNEIFEEKVVFPSRVFVGR